MFAIPAFGGSAAASFCRETVAIAVLENYNAFDKPGETSP
jgi:hypothetical protein